MKLKNLLITITLLVLLTVSILSLSQSDKAYAALPWCGYLGTVTEKDAQDGTFTLQSEYYDFAGGNWQPCAYVLTVDAPNPDAIANIQIGDYVEAYTLGDPGTPSWPWYSLAKIEKEQENGVIEIYGDLSDILYICPGSQPVNLAFYGDLTLEVQEIPDCTNCSSILCDTAYSEIVITRGDYTWGPATLFPGESCTAELKGYNINVMFYSGVADGYPECTSDPGGGPQAFSNFSVEIWWDLMFYDLNDNGMISYGEMLNALMDYLANDISYSQMIDVLLQYLIS